MDKYHPYDRCNKHDWRAEFKRLDGAYAPATIRSYFTDVAIFERWCDDHGRTFLPATTETVCAFLEDQAPALASSTVRRRLYAIRKAHRLLDLPDPTFAEDINLAIRRVRRQKLGRPR